MSAPERRRIVVLGGGPGGYVAALRAAALGADVVLVESATVGGVCLNEGCIPSKVLLHATEIAAEARRVSWLRVDDAPNLIDLRALQEFKSGTVGRLVRGIEGLLRSRGVRVLRGTGSLVDRGRVRVVTAEGVEDVDFDAAILATGSEPVELAHLPFDGSTVVHARHVLEWDTAPASVLIVGGGVIGFESATYLAGLGTRVTLVEAAPRVLLSFDPAIARHPTDELRSRGVKVLTSTTVRSFADGVAHLSTRDGEDARVDADHVVVAVGRRPRRPDAGSLPLEVTDSGHVVVDAALRTSLTDVYAIGDLTLGPPLAHRAMAQAKVAAENAVRSDDRPFDPVGVPSVVYTTPELAQVGHGVESARALGFDPVAHTFSLRGNGRALGMGATGEAVLVSDRSSGLVLGAEIAGPSAGEIVGGVAIGLELGAVVEDLAATVLPHPSIGEVVNELADLALGLGVHGA